MNLIDKKILIVGSTGLLGSALCALLDEKGIKYTGVSSKDYNVLNKDKVRQMFHDIEPEVVFNLFVSFGGIINNEAHPAQIFEDNLIGNMNIISCANEFGVERLVQLGSQCSYADTLTPPFKEGDIWSGLPTENNAPYGIAKRTILMMTQSYRKEFGFPGIYLIPSNMYGPRDNFHPKHAHVIPTLIRRFIEAKEQNKDSVEIWGNGLSTREFLYNKDAAEALILAAEKYNDSDPVNIGTGKEISVLGLAELIADLTGFSGDIVCNNNGLDGQKRRRNDVSRAKTLLGWEAKTSLEDGLKQTIDYFLKNRDNLRETVIYG